MSVIVLLQVLFGGRLSFHLGVHCSSHCYISGKHCLLHNGCHCYLPPYEEEIQAKKNSGSFILAQGNFVVDSHHGPNLDHWPCCRRRSESNFPCVSVHNTYCIPRHFHFHHLRCFCQVSSRFISSLLDEED